MVDQVELRSEFLELAERCEKATGYDLDIDHAIGRALGTNGNYSYRPYTHSLDAAMTLVDPDVFFHLSRFSPGEGPANAHVYPNRCLGDDYEADAATPALALCAAALRSRTTTTPERSDD